MECLSSLWLLVHQPVDHLHFLPVNLPTWIMNCDNSTAIPVRHTHLYSKSHPPEWSQLQLRALWWLNLEYHPRKQTQIKWTFDVHMTASNLSVLTTPLFLMFSTRCLVMAATSSPIAWYREREGGEERSKFLANYICYYHTAFPGQIKTHPLFLTDVNSWSHMTSHLTISKHTNNLHLPTSGRSRRSVSPGEGMRYRVLQTQCSAVESDTNKGGEGEAGE